MVESAGVEPATGPDPRDSPIFFVVVETEGVAPSSARSQRAVLLLDDIPIGRRRGTCTPDLPLIKGPLCCLS